MKIIEIKMNQLTCEEYLIISKIIFSEESTRFGFYMPMIGTKQRVIPFMEATYEDH